MRSYFPGLSVFRLDLECGEWHGRMWAPEGGGNRQRGTVSSVSITVMMSDRRSLGAGGTGGHECT